MLRILRRIRELDDDELPPGPFLKKDDVSGVWVESSESGMSVDHMKVTKDGDFEALWPEGFFEKEQRSFFRPCFKSMRWAPSS